MCNVIFLEPDWFRQVRSWDRFVRNCLIKSFATSKPAIAGFVKSSFSQEFKCFCGHIVPDQCERLVICRLWKTESKEKKISVISIVIRFALTGKNAAFRSFLLDCVVRLHFANILVINFCSCDTTLTVKQNLTTYTRCSQIFFAHKTCSVSFKPKTFVPNQIVVQLTRLNFYFYNRLASNENEHRNNPETIY